MNKRNTLFLTSCVFMVASLSSCSLFDMFKKEATNLEITKEELNDGSTIYKHNLDNRRILSSSGINALKSTGNQKLLVIPVNFQDGTQKYGNNTLPNFGYSNEIEAMEKAFFGKTEDTGWESVSSYYSKSSYGKLNISGEVSPIVNLSRSAKYYENILSLGTSDIGKITSDILEECLNSIKSEVNLKDYDLDEDGYIDAVWMVYNIEHDDGDLFWAFTTVANSSKSKLEYKPKTYAWASYSFFSEGGYSRPDSHTFIHETGHILGLDDYYSYDLLNPQSPMGGLDMMDYNIGDHNAFSKYMLEWINPRYVNKSGLYRLENFQNTGDAIIISPKYNGTPFCEYLILEYYSPTNLNYADSNNHYTNNDNYPFMFQGRGLRILHVDARLGMVKSTDDGYITWNGMYENDLKYYTSGSRHLGFIASNTNMYTLSENTSDNLVELVSSQTKVGFVPTYSSVCATTVDLFGISGYLTNFKFNNGIMFNFELSIIQINGEAIEIKIETK